MQELDPIEEEMQSALRKAHVLRARGDNAGADAAVMEAVARYPEHPQSLEIKADAFISQGKLAEARDVLAEAMKRSPGRVSLERKHAEVVLKIAEKDMAIKAAMEGIDIQSLMNPAGVKRHSGTAAFLNVLLPGFGQVYNGELGKGLVIAAVAVVLWVGLFTFGLDESKISGQNSSRPTSLFWPFVVLLLSCYIVSILDAAVTAGKTAAPPPPPRPTPPVDKPFE